jgi:hypothetical protein
MPRSQARDQNEESGGLDTSQQAITLIETARMKSKFKTTGWYALAILDVCTLAFSVAFLLGGFAQSFSSTAKDQILDYIFVVPAVISAGLIGNRTLFIRTFGIAMIVITLLVWFFGWWVLPQSAWHFP